MNKHLIKRIFIAFLAGVLISLNALPVYSQLDSVTATCSQAANAAACFAELGWSAPSTPLAGARSALSTLNAPSPFLGLTLPSKEAVVLVGGSAALWYLGNNDMQSIRDKAVSSVPLPFIGGQGVGVAYNFDIARKSNYNGATQTYPYNNIKGPLSAPYLKQYSSGYGVEWGIDFTNYAGARQFLNSNSFDASYTNFRIQNVRRSDGQPDTAGNIPFSLSAAIAAMPDSSIYSQAAIAAAAAALNPNDSLSKREAALAAAMAARGFVQPDTPEFTAANSAVNAAAAAVADAAATAAAAAAAADQKAKDEAALKAKSGYVSGKVNFVVYALRAFATKFPFDFLYSVTPVTSFECPAFTFFYYRFEFCFLVPLFVALRWIATISIALKMIYTM